MCGIFGYIGYRQALPLLIEGLRKLEYRGYDSAGISILEGNSVFTHKCVGKIQDLETLLRENHSKATMGIAHTRWATHGHPSTENSHPHFDCKKEISLVHNGIIENYQPLKKRLVSEGHIFTSVTDTEVLVHLVESHHKGNLEEAVRLALQEIVGSYAIAAISKHEPLKIVVARKGSPLIIGIGDEDEHFVASDIPALLKYTSKVIPLKDGEIAVLNHTSIRIETVAGKSVHREPQLVSWDPVSAEKGGYAHFMLKEIHEQPQAIINTLAGRVDAEEGTVTLEELGLTYQEIQQYNRIIFTACGTSWHAALVGEYLFEELVRIPTEVEYAAEFRYRQPILDDKTLVIAISQSGETADTLGAIEEAKQNGAKVISICNVVGSSIARESDGVIYTHAGPEIGVASTKAFTTQITVIYLLAVHFASVRKALQKPEIQKLLRELLDVPEIIKKVLVTEGKIQKISERFQNFSNALYLGRGKGFPIALEGALKLKEISYIHAEGYPAAEMKHGPIALIDQNMPVIVLALRGTRYEKILGNVEEVKARGGIVIAIATEGDTEIGEKADEVIRIPEVSEQLSPIVAVVPLQLFAYFIAVCRGCHVDQPRNLAKSVTVE